MLCCRDCVYFTYGIDRPENGTCEKFSANGYEAYADADAPAHKCPEFSRRKEQQ